MNKNDLKMLYIIYANSCATILDYSKTKINKSEYTDRAIMINTKLNMIYIPYMVLMYMLTGGNNIDSILFIYMNIIISSMLIFNFYRVYTNKAVVGTTIVVDDNLSKHKFIMVSLYSEIIVKTIFIVDMLF